MNFWYSNFSYKLRKEQSKTNEYMHVFADGWMLGLTYKVRITDDKSTNLIKHEIGNCGNKYAFCFENNGGKSNKPTKI